MHWGRMKLHEFGRFSTSAISDAIRCGDYTGWDDPRVPTLRALRKRGITADAIRKFMIDLGISETDISLSLDNLYAINRKIVDSTANRYFFVWDPVVIAIRDAVAMIATPLCHPDRSDVREIHVGGTVAVCSADLKGVGAGDRLRLKNMYDIEIVETNPLVAKHIGGDHGEWCATAEKPRYPIIHWVAGEHVDVVVHAPDQTYEGIGETGILSEEGNIVQFERLGFVRIDSVDFDENRAVAYFAHR